MAEEAATYPDWADREEQRRAFVLEQIANTEVDGPTRIKDAMVVLAWLKDGTEPVSSQPSKRERGSHLKPVTT